MNHSMLLRNPSNLRTEPMFLEIVLVMLAGVAFGTFTGLVPGIHPNTIFVIMVSVVLSIAYIFPPSLLLVFIISVAVSNTFVDFLPSVIFGAPDPSTALSVLPGHKMLLQGKGYDAVFLTVVGGLGVAVLTVLTLPILLYAIPAVFALIHPILPILLALVVAWVIIGESGMKKAYAFAVFLLSGIFGIVALTSYPGSLMLFPSLTGLFALSNMILSYHTTTHIVRQTFSSEIDGEHRKGILSGWLAGWFAGMLPGIGASQAAVVAANVFRNSTRDFLTAMGGINTSNILFTFIILFTIGRTRSGAVWAISQFSWDFGIWTMALIIFTGLSAAFISGIITLGLAKVMLKRVSAMDYRKMTMGVIVFLLLMIIILSGLPGMVAAFTGTLIGVLAIRLGIKRSHMMGFLIVPTIIYFAGWSPHVMFMLGS